ncbi:homoserine kinase [Chloropicon primus]|uniref:Homoserine kinase n=1 Tax=Chloropicon primus TaxID=1764295 RepID=A0A5B8MUH8_9CHLO|nr:homoserine kinase [Chloropicon primus]UPR02527.1 homoserine kinase [Chloropicon primus]|eukprot:QDZ23315.1 homoserine kinase [Chloropicon primus]
MRRRALEPKLDYTSAFAPSTVANLGPGFDLLGCAVEGRGDTVAAKPMEVSASSTNLEDRVLIERIEGDLGRLTLESKSNCAGIAAIETLRLMERECGPLAKGAGVSLDLEKGLPLGSGLGSSAASAAAAAMATNVLFGSPLPKAKLVEAGIVSEAAVSGYHADNIAPAVLGGFILVKSTEPLVLQQLDCPSDLWFVVVTPVFEAPTKKMRAVLPKEVSMQLHIENTGACGELLLGIVQGDIQSIGHGLNSDTIIEPTRAPLIPGFSAVKGAAIDAGALGCTISGAGPTAVAVVGSKEDGRAVLSAMKEAFKSEGSLEIQYADVVKLCKEGAKTV